MVRRRRPTQPSLFREPIPVAPEGFYSSGPNSNLGDFVAASSTPYDTSTDDYAIGDFSAELKGNRHSALYNFLSYPSKKPYEPIEKYLSHFTRSDDLVLDPFCGSGGVGVVGEKLGRRVVLLDSSPLATMISAAYCAPAPVSKVNKAFDALQRASDGLRSRLYGTNCHLCDGAAEVEFVIYSQTYRCLKCFNIVPLASCGSRKSCPFCGEKISTRQKRMGIVPWGSKVRCLEGCSDVPLRFANDENKKARRYFDQDIDQHEAGSAQVVQQLKAIPMLHHTGEDTKWGLLWRPYHGDIKNVGDFFSDRNLRAILDIRSAIAEVTEDPEVRRVLLLALANVLPSVSKQQRYYPGSSFPNMAMPGVLYIPPVNEELNVYRRFLSKRRTIVRGLEAITKQIRTADICVSTQSALDMSAIPDSTVDYVFTDPPYSGRIQYGELNHIQEAVLDLDTSWINAEVIVNKFRGWDLKEWAQRLRIAMEEVYRVLKPGRWISVCYHDSDPASWIELQDMMLEIGFLPGISDKVSSMETGWLSLKMHTSENITKRDLVINFRKPHPRDHYGQLALDFSKATFEEEARKVLSSALDDHPGFSPDLLYDTLVSRMVRRGTFERHDFDALLHSVAEESPPGSGRWYLLETADQVDDAERVKEEAAAAKLEAFMRERLAAMPGEPGVHYSDLFEQYLLVQDKPRRMLADWLPEYFYKTVEGTWRPPESDEEQAQKAALRASGALRRIKRFALALIEGVPPHDRDCPENAATAADWLRQCRRAGLYEYGRALYEMGGFDFSGLSELAQLEAEEDYQVCVRRSG